MPAIFVWKSQTRRSTPSDLATEVGRTKPPHSPTKYCTIKYHLSKRPQTPPGRKKKPTRHTLWMERHCVHSFYFYFYFFLKRPRVFNVIRVWQNSKRTQCLKAAVFAWLVFSHSLTLAYFIIQGCCCFEKERCRWAPTLVFQIKVLSLHHVHPHPKKTVRSKNQNHWVFFPNRRWMFFFFSFYVNTCISLLLIAASVN